MTTRSTRRLSVRALACLTVFSCGGFIAAAAAEPDDVLLAYLEIWNTGEVDTLEEIVTQDFVRHAGPDESVRSRAELARLVTRTRSLYERVRITTDDQMVAGGKGAFRGTFYGVHRKTRGIVSFPVMGMVRLVNDRIAEEWIIGDNFLSLMALGYELVPPGFEAIPPPGAAEEDPERIVRP